MNIQINNQNYNTSQIQQGTNDLPELRLLEGKQVAYAIGEILSGRITEMKGNAITLLLDNGQSLSAKLNGNMDIEPGQNLSFEVKSNANNQTELRPLYTNLTATPTALSALSEASLPATDRNVSMVMNMMEEGMAVNKQALLDMVSNLNAHPSVDSATLVQMQKLGLTIDESTITQFENYKNFEHKIVGDVIDMSEGLSNLFTDMVEEGEPAFDKASMVLDIALNSGNEESVRSDLPDIKQEINDIELILETIVSDDADATQTLPNNNLLNRVNDLLKLYLNNTEAFSKEDGDSLKQILSNSVFKDALKEGILKQLTLRPEDIKEDGKVEELYKRILETGNKTLDILNNTSLATGQTAKSAQNLMDNVQFMNQINEMMTYVQLPLKLSQENAHGDLYVYTNKKKLAEKDGNFSALLHLDMEHLGPMDVYVAMQMEKVSTHFYMQDEATLDFIEQHIHLLDERLTGKGYKMNSVVSVKEDESKSMVDTFLEDKKNEGTVGIVSKLSFDVRA